MRNLLRTRWLCLGWLSLSALCSACLQVSAPSDASAPLADAEPFDAGVIPRADATATDALGLDAQPADAVAPDAAAADAMEPDALEADANPTDSAVADASAPDADAGLLDAAPAGDAGPLQRLGFLDLPPLMAGGAAIDEGTEWVNGEGRALKDNHGAGEFMVFRWAESPTTRTFVFASGDGQGWREIPSDPLPGRLLAVVQDSQGLIHGLLGANDYSLPELREYYVRFRPNYTGSALSGLSLEAQIALPPHHRSVNVLTDLRGDLQLIDYDGAESLIYVLSVTTVSGVSTQDIKVSVGRAASLTPSGPGDFLALDGSAGDSLVFDSCTLPGSYCARTPAFLSTHNMIGRVAQLGLTRDLYLLVGPIEADYGIGDPSQLDSTRIHLSRLSWNQAQRGWSIGAPAVIAEADGQYIPQLLNVAGTDGDVRVMTIDPRTGVHVGVIDAAGSFADLTNPAPLVHYNGWGALSAAPDGVRMWAIWNTCTSDNSTPDLDCTDARSAEAVWDGTRWQTFDDPLPSGDNSGIGATAAWRDGVGAILFRGTLLRPRPPVPQFAAIWGRP
ncbi:MAG: hypothetical protein U1E65_23250 [Myxococcota bacterium]